MWSIVPSLFIIWLVGLLASRTGGGLLHILPLAALFLAGVLLAGKMTGYFRKPDEEGNEAP